MTGLALINKALKTLGALASGETADPDEASDALDRLNDLIDAWGTQDLTIYMLLRTVVPLVANTVSYIIGTGGTINIVRPTEISAAGLILDTSVTPNQEVEIDVLTDQEWEAIPQKTYTASYTGAIYFDHNWVSGLARIYPFPIPTVSTSQLILYTPQALAQMTLAGDVTFPPGYRRFLRYGLARELAPEFGGWDEAKENLYLDCVTNVKSKNLRMSELQMPAGVGGNWRSNIYTGQA